VRIWLLRKSGQPLALSIGSVAIERGTGIVLIGLMISACLPAVWVSMHNPALRQTLAFAGPMMLVGLVIAALADKLTVRWLPGRVAGPLAWLGEGLRRLARHPMHLLEIALLGVVASITGLLAAYVVGEGLGIGLGLPAYIVLVGGALLLSVLPISLGGWGVRELGMVALFGAVGVRAERAMALSLIWGLLPLVVSLPAGLLWWLGGKATPASEIVVGSDGAQLSLDREMHRPR